MTPSISTRLDVDSDDSLHSLMLSLRERDRFPPARFICVVTFTSELSVPIDPAGHAAIHLSSCVSSHHEG